jgi:hypothetical protein
MAFPVTAKTRIKKASKIKMVASGFRELKSVETISFMLGRLERLLRGLNSLKVLKIYMFWTNGSF